MKTPMSTKTLFGIVLALMPGVTFAAGVDLSWNDCVPYGARGKTFTCSGEVKETYLLELQHNSPVAIPSFVALTSFLELVVTGDGWDQPLAPFWHYEAGGCNGGAFKGALLFGIPSPQATGCAALAETWDLDDDQVPEGITMISAYMPDHGSPGRGYFVLLSARGDPTPLSANTNYWGHELRLNNVNRPEQDPECVPWPYSACTQQCDGCRQSAYVAYRIARLEGTDGLPVDITGAGEFSDCVLINGASESDCGVVAVHDVTWGELKRLFR